MADQDEIRRRNDALTGAAGPRAQAIETLLEALSHNPPSREVVTLVVDALIKAARAPESEHTRTVSDAQRKALNDPRV